jgi:hypothetical protein
MSQHVQRGENLAARMCAEFGIVHVRSKLYTGVADPAAVRSRASSIGGSLEQP